MLGVKKKVAEALAGARYCYPILQMDGRVEYPKADAEELGEFCDFICSIVNGFRKEAYFAGYKAGARDMFVDLKAGTDFVFDASQAEHGAWKTWGEYDSDER